MVSVSRFNISWLVTKSGSLSVLSDPGMPVKSGSAVACAVVVDDTPESVLSVCLFGLLAASFASEEIVCFWAATLVPNGALLG